jgi:hypothetical protein
MDTAGNKCWKRLKIPEVPLVRYMGMVPRTAKDKRGVPSEE